VEGGLPRLPGGGVDYSKDFFSKPAYLTVSGQLNAEYYASALSNVYTFGEPCYDQPNSLLISVREMQGAQVDSRTQMGYCRFWTCYPGTLIYLIFVRWWSLLLE
jgi:hypothetical protein